METKTWPTGLTRTGTAYWAAGGADIVNDDCPVNSLVNPACTHTAGSMVYAEMSYISSSRNVLGFTLDSRYVFPGYLGITVPYKSMIFSAGYSEYYHTTIDWDPSLDSFYKLRIYWGSLNYSLHKRLSLGLTLGMSLFSHQDKNSSGKSIGGGKGRGVFAAGGIQITPMASLRLGAVVRYLNDIEYQVKYDFVLLPPEESGIVDPVTIFSSYNYVAMIPMEIESGASYQIGHWVTLSGKAACHRWSYLEDDDRYIVNYAFGAAIPLIKVMTIRFGCFTFKDPKPLTYLIDEYDFTQQFLTFGITIIPVRLIKVSVSVHDSRLLANKNQDKGEQCYSMGIGYQF
ncbi:hypothetical protein JW935_19590 [candidate division KSB1 bacterium]|nr:hypothetical protein [candidate division KSB1 bacterium]